MNHYYHMCKNISFLTCFFYIWSFTYINKFMKCDNLKNIFTTKTTKMEKIFYDTHSQQEKYIYVLFTRKC